MMARRIRSRPDDPGIWIGIQMFELSLGFLGAEDSGRTLSASRENAPHLRVGRCTYEYLNSPAEFERRLIIC